VALNKASDQFLLDAYSGQNGFLTGQYLVRHPREPDEKFRRRQEVAVYPNFVRKIVDTYLGFLWRRTPVREVSDLYAGFSENADGRQRDIDHVMMHFQRLAMLLGTVYVLVDRRPGPVRTRADESLPYLSLRLPEQLVDYQLNDSGQFLRAVFQEQTPAGEHQFRIFTTDGWIVARDDQGVQTIDAGRYDFGKVPVVALHSNMPLNPTDIRSQGWAFDMAQLNWDLFNLRSELRELFRAQTFAILALPISDPGERERLKDMTVSTENAMTYDPAHGGQPAFIAPPDDPVRLYMDQIEATIQDIYRVANLEFVGGVQQSGVALSFHFQEANAELMTMADLCERAEKEIAWLVHAWLGQEFNGNIAYPRDFNLNDLSRALAQTMDAVSLNISPQFDMAIKKRLARQILAEDIAPSEMEAILRDIEAQGDQYGDRIQREGQ